MGLALKAKTGATRLLAFSACMGKLANVAHIRHLGCYEPFGSRRGNQSRLRG